MTKAIFFDIDGTLVSFKTHQIVPSARRALLQLREKGIKVFIATGRPLYLIKGLGDTPFDGYITFNGSYCVTGEKKPIYCHTVPTEELVALCRHEREKGPYPYSFMTIDRVVANYIDDCVTAVAQQLDLPVPAVADMEAVARNEKVIQIDLYLPQEKEAPAMNVIPHCFANRWSPLFTDINMKGDSKQHGIDIMLQHYGIERNETMAFGDGGNDITMLRHVAVGIAMGNASPEVKKNADYITDDIDNDGIEKALIHFGLL